MLDLLISLGLWGGIRQLRDAITLKLDEKVLKNGMKCPVCLSRQVWKDGHEKRKSRCPVQRYYCFACGRSFCINTLAPWYWHKYAPASIILFLWLLLSGESILSTRGKCSFSEKLPCWKTLWGWLLKFGSILILKCSKLPQKCSRYRAWQNDEMYVREKPIIGTVDPQTQTVFLTPSWHADAQALYSHMSRVLSKWKKKPRGWWTDEWRAYFPVLERLQIPHSTVKHRSYQFKNAEGITTNAIENVWRQLRRWLHRKNGLKHRGYVDFWVKLFEAVYNVIDSPLKMVELLV